MSDDPSKNPVTQRSVNAHTNRSSRVSSTKRAKAVLPPVTQAVNRPSPQDHKNESVARRLSQPNRLETLQTSAAEFSQRVNQEFNGGSKASRERFIREMQGDKHLTWGQARKEFTKPIDHGVAGARSAVSDIMSGKARKDLTKGIGDGVAGVRSAVSDIMSGKKVPDEEVPEIDAKKASNLAFQSVLDTFSDLSGKTDKTENEDRTNREKLLAKYYDPNTGKAATDAIAKLDQFKSSLGNTSPTDSKTQGSRAELPQQLGGLLDTASKMIEERPKDKKISWGELAGFGSNSDKSGSKTGTGGETKASPNRGQVDSAIKESTSDNTEKKSPKGNDQE